jgi:hypothetical protein
MDAGIKLNAIEKTKLAIIVSTVFSKAWSYFVKGKGLTVTSIFRSLFFEKYLINA